jgi:hypothetical protein
MKGLIVDEVGSKPKASAGKPKASIFRGVFKAINAVSRVLNAATASPRIWIAITCTLLAISGGARYWREGDFWGREATAREAPFSLTELPKEVGTWRMVEGSESLLDPDVAWAAGANSNLIRNYVDEKTGETANVLVIYGLAKWMIGHIPDYCYPYSGFEPLQSMDEYALVIPEFKEPVQYRGGLFTKTTAGVGQYVQVIYTLRNADEWITDATTRWKVFRKHPGMFKVQIAGTAPVDLGVESSPNVQLMGELVKAIEQQVSKASGKPGKVVGAGQITPKSN